MAAKRSASSIQNQPSKKKISYGDSSSVEDIFLTVDSQDISEWFAKEVKPNNQVDIEPLIIGEDEDTGVQHFTVSEQKKMKTYTNQNKEFVTQEIAKKNNDSSDTFFILEQDDVQKLRDCYRNSKHNTCLLFKGRK